MTLIMVPNPKAEREVRRTGRRRRAERRKEREEGREGEVGRHGAEGQGSLKQTLLESGGERASQSGEVRGCQGGRSEEEQDGEEGQGGRPHAVA